MRHRLLLTLGAFLVLCGSAFAEERRELNELNECVSVDAKDRGQGTLQVYGTFSGTITWYVSNGGPRVAVDLFPPDTTTAANSTTAAGAWGGNVAGWVAFEACMTSYTSGIATVVINASSTGGGGGGGGGVGGGDSNITQLGGTAIAVNTGALSDGVIRTTLATDDPTAINIGEIENILGVIENHLDVIEDGLSNDVSHGSDVILTGPQIQGEAKVIAGGLENPVTVGQSARLALSLSGAAMTVLVNEAGTSDIGAAIQTSLALLDDLSAFEDEDAFTYTTSKVAPIGAVAESTTDAIADGALGALTMDTARRLIVTPTPSTYGGLTPWKFLDLDEGSGEVIKSSPGQLYGLWITNTSTATRWIKLYDATSCTVGTGTPVLVFGIPGNTSDDVAGSLTGGGHGIAFSTGICIGAVTGVAENDTGAPGTNDVIVNALYK